MCAKRRVVFRADGNARIGLGHVVRSLALADVLREHFDLAFAIQRPTTEVADMVLKVCGRLLPLPQTDDLRADADAFCGELQPGDVVVLDGYRFDAAYQKACRDDGHRFLVCIDDLQSVHMYADAVINHGGGIDAAAYEMEPYTRLFLGPEYALLRRPFMDIDPGLRQFANLNQFFVCMGGADPLNLSRLALDALARVPEVSHVIVVTGSANPFREELEALLPDFPFTGQVLHNLDALAMCRAMQSCGSAIVPASSVAIEACAVGMRIFAGYFADNQKPFANYLASRGLANPLGELTHATAAGLAARIRTAPDSARMVARQQTIFGGRQRHNLFSIFKLWI
ncbi:MAG TPA: UDP-2,4-diacetamido-2,4,6-trideoxy-beta-L-altropyranose hydrolase [Bacteroidetes bacterium]|nr:UDP-2,4-diacetamido-2,4,6-trideoxy-beta-L-altropyranose hydrolase [Bacteroidota bacterium]